MSDPIPILIEVSPGELLDKIAVLEIKRDRISDPAKLRNILTELAVLVAARDRAVTAGDAKLLDLSAELRSANEALWDIIDEIYQCETVADFGPRYVQLARSVYRENDRRALAKRKINELLGSRLIEEKAHL